ncbi:hypothetical protein F4824DRAFT_455296 [Ustulina deusta]|nr:hypothetical protein F4824DRAFT_455296 [Ustulina deusta]
MEDPVNSTFSEHIITREESVPSPQDMQQIMHWNRNIPTAVSSLAHDLIQSRALSQPELPAVCACDGDLNYGELDALSSRLACHLASQGVRPEVLVPLCFEKSMWVIVSMLAVLKAGGAFVSLDPTQPQARLEHIVQQTQAKFMLASPRYAKTCAEIIPKVLIVDSSSTVDLEGTTSNITRPNPKNAAYIIFTSGSTGQPKGCVIEHEQLCTSSIHGGLAIGLDNKPRMLQFVSYAFDACIIEIIYTLIFGGCVCVPSDWDRMNNLAGVIKKMQVTSAFFTPSLFRNMEFQDIGGLDTVILGGESVPEGLINKWKTKVRLISMYGPTECAVAITALDYSSSKSGLGDLGKPFMGAWIVDQNDSDKLMHIGAIGELLIEGPTVGRGYLNDATKTRQAFIPPPHWMQEIGRQGHLYRTGDLVKYNNDGTMFFVGRKDHQVKIRGQRLEMGEVEHQLQKVFPTTTEVIVEVVTPSRNAGSPTLIAFLRMTEKIGYLNWEQDGSCVVTSSTEQGVLRSLVKQAIASLSLALPAYAIPTFFIPVQTFPFSVAGKLDRKRLRNIAAELSITELDSFTGKKVHRPLTILEQRLSALWQALLGISNAEAEDNFFHLGGDSIIAMKLVATARMEGLLLTVAMILKNPVLAEMALCTSTVQALSLIEPFSLLSDELLSSVLEAAKLSKGQLEDAYPASKHQDYFAAPANRYLLQCVFFLSPSMDLARFMAAWGSVATEHAIARTCLVQIPDGRNFQVVIKGGIEWRYETSLDGYLEKDKLDHIGFGDFITRFAIVNDENSGKRFFVWTASHTCYDGTSVPMLYTDLEHAFQNKVSPYQGLKFNQFIKHTLLVDQTPAEAFWRTYLAGSKSSTPTHPFCVVPESHIVTPDVNLARNFDVPKTFKSEITISTMAEVAMAIVFARHLKSDEVVFSQYRTGRNIPLPGVEDMVAPAMTKIPHRFQMKAGRKIQDMLYSSQRDLNDMATFEHLGWESIRNLSEDTKAACDAAIYLTVSAGSSFITNTWGKEIGLELIWTGITMHSPFRFSVKSSEGGIRVNTTFDGSLLSIKTMDKILRQFEQAMLQITEFANEQTLEDIYLDANWGEASILIPAVEAKSTEDRRFAVQTL